MLNFSSVKFSKLYMKYYIPPSIKIRNLRITDEYFNLLYCIINVIDLIDDNGGFTSFGWYKRGVIDGRSLVRGSNKKTEIDSTTIETMMNCKLIMERSTTV